jgi:hypothetical protein
MFTTPLYLASVDDREIVDCFLLDQHIALEPKLRVYPDVDLQSMLLPTQSESLKLMRSNAEPDA